MRWALCAVVVGALAFPAQQDAARQNYDAFISRVRVDAIVTDHDGRFVTGLGVDDFMIYEDGEPQPILDVQLVDATDEAPSAAEAASVATDRARPEAAPTTSAPRPGALVFVIDGLNAGRRGRSRFVRQWAEFDATEVSIDVPRAAYLIDSLGRVHELARLSPDPEVMRTAIERAFGEPVGSEPVDPELDALRRAMVLGTPLDPVTAARRLYDALTALCNALATLPGRKAVVWVSEGLSLLDGGPQPSHGQGFPGVENDRRITSRQQAFHEAANTAGVSVYGLDPQLVTWTHNGASVSSRSTGPVDAIIREASGPGALRWDDDKDALIQTSRATGGRAFPYAGNIPNALRTIQQDTARYYLLTYATPEPLGDGLYHDVDVEVRYPELEVRARAGYVDLPANARHDRALQANMKFSMSLSELTVVAKAYRRWDPDGNPVIQVAATATDAEGRPDNDWQWFHAVAFDRDGWTIGQVHLPITGAEPNDASGAPAPADWPVVHVENLSLPPGSQELTVALADEPGNRVGATDLPVEIAEEAAWQASDLILALRPGPDSPLSRPLLDDRVRAGEIVTAYVEVRGGEQPVLAGSVAGPTITAEPVRLSPVTLHADRYGLHRGAMIVRLDQPGSYLLEVSIVDAPAGERKTLTAEILVVAGASR